MIDILLKSGAGLTLIIFVVFAVVMLILSALAYGYTGVDWWCGRIDLNRRRRRGRNGYYLLAIAVARIYCHQREPGDCRYGIVICGKTMTRLVRNFDEVDAELFKPGTVVVDCRERVHECGRGELGCGWYDVTPTDLILDEPAQSGHGTDNIVGYGGMKRFPHAPKIPTAGK